MAIDWAAARFDYVTHHELTVAISQKVPCQPFNHLELVQRAKHWTAERKVPSERLVEKSTERIVFSR